jgi:hypothetical protein
VNASLLNLSIESKSDSKTAAAPDTKSSTTPTSKSAAAPPSPANSAAASTASPPSAPVTVDDAALYAAGESGVQRTVAFLREHMRELATAAATADRSLQPYEIPHSIAIELEPFTPQNQKLTPSFKLNR